MKKGQKAPALKDLYPQLDPTQLEALDAFYDRYARLIISIYNDVSQDKDAWARFIALTERPGTPPQSSRSDG